jgi:hypothetical protein
VKGAAHETADPSLLLPFKGTGPYIPIKWYNNAELLTLLQSQCSGSEWW